MANGKRYFWIKLKDSFLTSDKVDYLMSQKDGANYIVLYQMLCLKTINTDGELARQIGEILIPYDVEKIARDCKYFSVDTVRVALDAFKALGMVYEQDNGILRITDFGSMVGSETGWAEIKRNQRNGQCPQIVQEDVHIEKDIDIRDKRLEKDIEKKKDKKEQHFFEDAELDSKFLEFLEYRKKIKKPIKTDRGIQTNVNKLKELATLPFADEINVNLAIKIINQTLDNEWQTFYAINGDKQTKAQTFTDKWEQAIRKAREDDEQRGNSQSPFDSSDNIS